METYEIFKDLAIILISAKLCGLLAAGAWNLENICAGKRCTEC